jgi:hypothetical protein
MSKVKFEVCKSMFPSEVVPKTGGKWYIGVRGNGYRYLHNDGRIRDGASHDGKWTGWYRTRQDARNAIKAYRQKNGV